MQLKKAICLCLLIYPQGITNVRRVNPIKEMDFQHFSPYLHKQNDSLYIVNFWASWCIPCREELPAFEKIGKKYANQKLKVLLVSLDIPNQVESRLIPFLRKNKIKSEVILLNDPNQNQWIDQVDSKWTGAIPFTVVYGKGFRNSYEHSLNFNELDSIIKLKIY
jgi:thiol-disulfide isomerase/thioredoxin